MVVIIEYLCPKCNYTWIPKVKERKPVSCPRCKVRFDRYGYKEKLKENKDYIDVVIE